MKLHFLTLLFCVSIISSLTAQQMTIAGDSATIGTSESRTVVYTISMIKLIVDPEKYHNKEVIVSGFLKLEFEGKAIYLHEEDYKNGLNKNGFWVDFSDKVTRDQLSISSGEYVMLRGTFDSKQRGHFGLWSGTIKDITSVSPLPKGE